VLADDGDRIVVVERTPEEALIVRLSQGLERDALVAQAVRLGHAFGNQHVAVEAANGEIRVPITTSREVAAATVRSLGLDGAEIDFALVQLGLDHPLAAPAHRH
jgi:urease accessory protein